MALDYEGAIEELVQVDSAAGTTLTVTRAIDGTSAASHNAGARVRHTSSARDFSDSRTHENSDDGIHGLAVGDVIVGEDATQTLTNKTLAQATGTLRNVTLSNTGTNITYVSGDAATPSNGALAIRPTTVANQTFRINNDGGTFLINTVSVDASNSTYKLRITKSNATSDIFSVLSGGQVVAWLSNGTNGYTLNASPDDAKRFAFQVNSNGGVQRSVIYTDGSTFLKNTGTLSDVLILRPAVGQDVLKRILRVENSGGTEIAGINVSGQFFSDAGLVTTGNVTTDTLTVNTSATLPVTSGSGGSVGTIASGWSLNSANAMKVGGTTHVTVSVSRTGATITPNPTSGQIDDVQIFSLATAFQMRSGYSAITASISDGGSHGTGRLNTDQTIDFTTWMGGVDIVSGSANSYRISFSFPSA